MSSVRDILSGIGYDLRDLGRSYRAKPLYRESGNNTSLVINKETGEWHDFSTNQHGDLSSLIKLTLRLPDGTEMGKYMDGFTPVPASECVRLEQPKIFSKELLVKLQKDYSYWEGRGVSRQTLELFQGGVVSTGKMANRFVFPIFDDKQDIVGFSGRDLLPNSDYRPKWKHIGSKSRWCYPLIFNKEIILRERKVVIVESIGDLLALWDSSIKNVIVSFGTELSSAIISTFIKFDMDEIILAFNNEPDNNRIGNNAAEDAREQLLQHFDERQIKIGLPTKKDFGAMNYEEIALWKKHQLG
jgi:hypothetical protein